MSYHYVYLLTNRKDGVLYVGVTTDLKRRIWQHKNKTFEGFSKRYNLNRIVYYETYEDYWLAAERERRMKKWNRGWKIELIEKANPEWQDLYEAL